MQRNHHHSALYKIPEQQCPEEIYQKADLPESDSSRREKKRPKMRTGFCFSVDVAINVGIRGFNFQREKEDEEKRL